MVALSAVIGDEGAAVTSSAKPSLLMQRLLPTDVSNLRQTKSNMERPDVVQAGSEVAQQDWSSLLIRIKQAGTHMRDLKSQSEEEDIRVQELLDQVRLDMKAASDRVRAAEQRALDIEERASRLIRAAEKRAEAAEHDAQLLQDRFAAFSELISQEFPIGE